MTTSQSPPALIAALLDLARKEDRGALAALRRGLGTEPGSVPAMFPYVEPYLGAQPSRARERAGYLVAALFASHPMAWEGEEPYAGAHNLGASFRRLSGPDGISPSTEGRFRALLSCHRDDLPEHLRHAISLLQSKDVPVDWARLWYDIQSWDTENRWVQRRWARQFWGGHGRTEDDAAEPAPADEKETTDVR
jgi:CRISPR type I-E-associated protein CasB/Cse2